jgi:uncharacterized protein YybS (DUF2232 family)
MMMQQRGLYVVLGALVGYALFGTFAALGFAAVAVNLLTPLPAAFVGMRVGATSALAAVGLTALLILLSGDLTTVGMYLVQFGIPGVLLPWLLNRGMAWDKSAAIVLWAMVAASICGLLVVSVSAGQSPLVMADQLIGSEIAQTTTLMQDMFSDADLPADQRKEVGRAIEGMATFLQKAYPGIAITVSGVMTLGLIFLLSLLARGRYVVPGSPFDTWKSPEQLVWVLIVSGFLVFLADGFASTFALNLLVILLPVYFLQGLAVIDCFFRRKAFAPIVRVVGYLLVTLINPLPMVVTGIGVFDLWADFRKPREPES